MSSIPLPALGIRSPQFEGPLDQYKKVVQLRSLLQGQQLGQQTLQSNQLKLQQQQQARQEGERIDQIIARHEGDVRSALPEIMAVSSQVGMDYRNQLLEFEKLGIEKQKELITLGRMKTERRAQLARSVTDQASQEAAINQGLQEGLYDEATAQQMIAMPFDPENIKRLQRRGLTTKQFLDFEQKRIDAEAKRKELAEKPPPLITVKTVDDEGNLVTRVVPKTEGAEFPAQPPQPRPSSTMEDIDDVADAIVAGQAPPDMRLYSFRDRTAITARTRRKGYNLAEATRDWYAVRRHLSSLNSPQQLRLRQATDFTYHSLNLVQEYFNDWKETGLPGGFRLWNKAALAAAKQLPGEAGAKAQILDAIVNDLVAELAVVYRGGNTSTDETLQLAAQNLGSNWNEETFKKALTMLRKTLRIRWNSIQSSQPMGVTPGSPYSPQEGQGGAVEDFGPAGDKPEGSTGTLEDGTKVIVRNGRIVKR